MARNKGSDGSKRSRKLHRVQFLPLPLRPLSDLEVPSLKSELCFFAVAIGPVAELVTIPRPFDLERREFQLFPDFHSPLHEFASRKRRRFISPRTGRVDAENAALPGFLHRGTRSAEIFRWYDGRVETHHARLQDARVDVFIDDDENLAGIRA